MFRKWLSGYYRRNKEKIELLIKILLGVVCIVFIMSLVFKNMNKEKTNTNVDTSQTTYKQKETIISGNDVAEEKYQEDSKIVKEFVEYCNNGKTEEAYNLLTDGCKQNLYPTLEDFKQKYCDKYFNTKKEYSLQSWIKKGNNVTYQMRIMEDIISSGQYQSGGTYQDYITVLEEEKKVNINGYIGKKEINKNTNLEGLNIDVVKVEKYMNYEEYTLKVTNNTQNVVMLDSMKNPTYTLRLVASGNSYPVRIKSISYTELIVNPDEEREMKIQFNKGYSSESNANSIMFSQIVRNYNDFMNNQAEYNDFTTVKAEI